MEISVIIPTFRPQDYLWECLDSLFSQTLPKDQYEVIVILNGEREPYHEMIQKNYYRKKYFHIYYFRNSK